jgi:hypothetical protein
MAQTEALLLVFGKSLQNLRGRQPVSSEDVAMGAITMNEFIAQ